MEMVKIKKCTVTGCVYNHGMECSTPAITVGSPHATCDTFMSSQDKAGVHGVKGGVGACRVSSCKFNQSLECHAPGIDVGMHADHADCETFSSR